MMGVVILGFWEGMLYNEKRGREKGMSAPWLGMALYTLGRSGRLMRNARLPVDTRMEILEIRYI